jgi:hypothetical protein
VLEANAPGNPYTTPMTKTAIDERRRLSEEAGYGDIVRGEVLPPSEAFETLQDTCSAIEMDICDAVVSSDCKNNTLEAKQLRRSLCTIYLLTT